MIYLLIRLSNLPLSHDWSACEEVEFAVVSFVEEKHNPLFFHHHYPHLETLSPLGLGTELSLITAVFFQQCLIFCDSSKSRRFFRHRTPIGSAASRSVVCVRERRRARRIDWHSLRARRHLGRCRRGLREAWKVTRG